VTKSRLLSLLANLVWLASCLPATLAFLAAVRWPERCQRQLLRRMLEALPATRYGRESGAGVSAHMAAGFHQLPIADYESLRPFVRAIQEGEPNVLTVEPIVVLQPTSGTGAAPKLIPFTQGLRQQFQAALAPWMASLFARHPGLLLGRQYWCVSPNTRSRAEGRSAVPVGFADDTDYLGGWQRRIVRQLLVAPGELARVEDSATFEFLTLLFLVREENIRLVSVWHPSFLTVLVEALPGHAAALDACLRSGELPDRLALPADLRASLSRRLRPDPERAAAIARMNLADPADICRLWPHLKVISCWTGREAEAWVARLRGWFPRVVVQGKGLMATEGVVSIPWGPDGRFVCAVRSHFVEFLAPGSTHAKRCWEVETGNTYAVVITTAGGLWRYRLGDLVRVTGRCGRAPCLEFVGREGGVSDLCGEKLTLADVEAALDQVCAATGVRFTFVMLVPERQGTEAGYDLLIQPWPGTPSPHLATCADAVDTALQTNFHYLHARRLGQLRPVRARIVRGDADRQYRARLLKLGARHGDIKYPALRIEMGWPAAFEMEPGEESGSWRVTSPPPVLT
jgi:hypothetical protein